MKISTIFVIKKDVLYSVAYDDEAMEFERLLDQFEDIEFLETFFEENINDLNSGYYSRISVPEAIQQTRISAVRIRKQFDEFINSKSNHENLQSIFRPLSNSESTFKQLSKEKNKSGWLRIYAIRVSKNTYVISGGAIKLTATMNEIPHLLQELKKLDLTKQFLVEQGLTDEYDFGFFEFQKQLL